MVTSKVKAFCEDINYKIEYNPSSFKVVKVIRKKYKDKDHIYQTLSDNPFPHSPLTPSLAANLIEMKFNLGIPFYRYYNHFKANGLKSEKYLTYVLSNINKKDINDLLQWSNNLPKDLLITNKDI